MSEENAYSTLFKSYDLLNSETDYSRWADFIVKVFEKYSGKTDSVLDLGCGTGAMTFELYKRGYDMTAIDISPEMLSVARDRADEQGITDILWLCQDMRSFELYGTVSGVVCCLDGINHLTGAGELEKCFSLVHNYTEPGGMFVFDVNTPYKFANFYGKNDYILEENGVVCCWQNDYNKKRGICDFYLTVFEEADNGNWRRTDTVQRERCYTKEKIEKALNQSGFEICGIYGDYEMREPVAESERWYIAAKVCDK